MAINYFTFNGISALSKGLYVSGSGTFNAPEKDYEVVSIPGRSGDLLIDNSRFKNVDLVYPSIIFEDYLSNTSGIRNWLLSADGYCRLEDTYHPDEYRMAYFTGPIDIETILLQAGECDITFKCKPQRYLKSGETLISSTTFPFTVANLTPFASSPIVYIVRDDIYDFSIITIAGNRIKISDECPHKYIAIDSDRRSVYGYSTESDMLKGINGMNDSMFTSISLPDFPKFNPGNIVVGYTCYNITKVSYRGRWWIV